MISLVDRLHWQTRDELSMIACVSSSGLLLGGLSAIEILERSCLTWVWFAEGLGVDLLDPFLNLHLTSNI